MATRLAPVRVAVVDRGLVRLEHYEYGTGLSPGIAPHAHDELQLCYSPNGGGHIRVGRVWRGADPGRVHVIAARVEHSASRNALVERPAMYHVVYIAACLGVRTEGTPDTVPSGPTQGYQERSDERAVRAIRRLISTALRSPEPSITEDAAMDALEALDRPSTCPAREPDLAGRVRDLLLAHTKACASLATLAFAMGTSPHRVRAVFKNAYGVPPARYHMLQRLAAARGLLIAGKPLASVASATGFVDQAHLTNRMRRYFGHAPGAVRHG